MRIRRSEVVLLVQAAAILLPVAALSGIALHNLREDKEAIEQEARERAKVEAPELARGFGLALQSRIQNGIAGRIRDGQPLAVPDYPRQPEPAAHALPGAAEWAQLELAERTGPPNGLIPRAVGLAHRLPDAVTESGTPLAGLALLLALRHVEGGVVPAELLRELDRNVKDYPSFLSRELLRVAKRVAVDRDSANRVETIDVAWAEQELVREKTRELVRRAAGQLIGLTAPTAIRVVGPVSTFLAFCEPAPGGWNLSFVDDRGRWVRLPRAYEELTAQVDGEPLHFGGAHSTNMVLASAGGALPGGHAFRIGIDLANPELLYLPYRKRLDLTEWLICFAAATAILGLASLWMGYQRQARLSEMKSNFVSSVSHELRAPLAAVRLMAESLDGGRVADEAKQKDYYRLILQECRRLSSLVENVLDLSRIGDGRKRYSFEPVDLAALVRQSVAVMEPCAAERQVSLGLAEIPGLQPIWDGHAVQQSLVNLLDNAIKHSPPGATVRVAVERDAGNVRLWVEDQGRGIPRREQKRIFEMFYRHGSELRRETKGAGIGLSIVQQVAKAHGGRVIVDSEVGRGSRFALELPLERPS